MKEQLVKNGYCTRCESATFESKKCEDKLPKSIWETYSAFANTFGGEIVMGFTELPDKKLKLTGVKNPEKIIKEFWDLLHDNHKVSVNLLTEKDVQIADCDELQYIIIHVPRADRHSRPVYINNDLNNGTYKRNNEGDYHCTVPEILEMGRDSSETAMDQRLVDGFSIECINKETLGRYRNHLRSVNPNHPWLSESDKEFLRLIGAADNCDEKLELTYAGLLMFGNDYKITRILPTYHLDYQEYDGGTEWSDRITSDSGLWSGNLFDFYLEIANRLFRSNKHPFSLNKDVRNDNTDIIAAQREAVLNGIVHADYMGRGGIIIKRETDTLTVRNPGCFRIPPYKAIKGGYTDARNPQIMKMFTLVGFVERAGSGVYRIMNTCSKNGLNTPTITEETDPSMVELRMYLNINNNKLCEETLFNVMRSNPKITTSEMSEIFDVSKSTISRLIEKMKDDGLIKREGGAKGKWIVIENDMAVNE